MSSIPRGPNHDDAAEPPTPGTNLPRRGLDQTLVGVAPTHLPSAPVTPTSSPGDHAADADTSSVAVKPDAIIATPVIAVSGNTPEQKLDEPAEPGALDVPRGLSRADADPALQSTALASDYLQAARDAALRKASVPRPRRPTTAAHEPSSAATLRASTDGPARDATNTAAGGNAFAAPPQSFGTQASVAPPLEAVAAGDGASTPSPLPHYAGATNTNPAHGGTPAQPSLRRFEPVPTVRAPLWEQAPPSVGRPLPMDNGAPDWEPLRPASSSLAANTGQRSRWYRLRWVALAAAALVAIVFAVFGEQLTRAPEGRVKLAETTAKPPANGEAVNAAPPEQTTLANRPASEPSTARAVAELPASAPAAANAPVSDESIPTPVIAPASADAPTSNAVAASKAKKKAVKRAKAKRKGPVTPASEPVPAEAK